MHTRILSEGLKEGNYVTDLTARKNYTCKLLRFQISTNHYGYNKITDMFLGNVRWFSEDAATHNHRCDNLKSYWYICILEAAIRWPSVTCQSFSKVTSYNQKSSSEIANGIYAYISKYCWGLYTLIAECALLNVRCCCNKGFCVHHKPNSKCLCCHGNDTKSNNKFKTIARANFTVSDIFISRLWD